MLDNISFFWILIVTLGLLTLGIGIYRRRTSQKLSELGQSALDEQLRHMMRDIQLSVRRSSEK